MMAALVQRWRDATAENARLRFALPLVAVLLFLFAWQELHRFRTGLENEASDERSQLARVESLRGQDIWIERAVETERVLMAARARLPNVRTPGLAQAAVQNELRALIQALGDIRPPQIDAQQVSGEALPSGVIQIRATMSAAVPPRKAMELLQRLENGTALTRVESVEIRGGVNPGVRLAYSRYFRQSDEEARE